MIRTYITHIFSKDGERIKFGQHQLPTGGKQTKHQLVSADEVGR